MAITERMVLQEMRRQGVDPTLTPVPVPAHQRTLADLLRLNLAIRIVKQIEDAVSERQRDLVEQYGSETAWAMMAEAIEGESE